MSDMFTNDHDRHISMQQSLHTMTLDDCEATHGLTQNQDTPALGEAQQQKEENTEASSMNAPIMLLGGYVGENEKMESMNDPTSLTGSSAETGTTAAPIQVDSAEKTEAQRRLPPPGPYYDETDLKKLFGEGYFDYKCATCWGSHRNAGNPGGCLKTCKLCGTQTHPQTTCLLLYCSLQWYEDKIRSNQKHLVRNCQIRPSEPGTAWLRQEGIIDDSEYQIVPNYDHPLVTEFYSNRALPYRLQYAPGTKPKKRKAGGSFSQPQDANNGSSSNIMPTTPKATPAKRYRGDDVMELKDEVSNLRKMVTEKDQQTKKLEMQLSLIHKDQEIQKLTADKDRIGKLEHRVSGLIEQLHKKTRIVAEQTRLVAEKDQVIRRLTVDHDILSRIELEEKVSKLAKLVFEKDQEIAGLAADNDVLRNCEYRPGKRLRF